MIETTNFVSTLETQLGTEAANVQVEVIARLLVRPFDTRVGALRLDDRALRGAIPRLLGKSLAGRLRGALVPDQVAMLPVRDSLRPFVAKLADLLLADLAYQKRDPKTG